jgi:uncharacterized RDD family membrane protein YckC
MKLSELRKRVNTISMGPRFGHFIIDMFIIQIISYLINLIPVFEISGFLDLLLYPLYYIIFEFFYQWTPGKFITGTIVIDDYGNKPDIQSIILRTFIRFVPFEPFSCLDEKSWGWHDKWTKTYVIKKGELSTIKSQLGLIDSENIPVQLESNKLKKNILIASILSVVAISGFIIIKQVREVMNFNFEETITNLNEADSKLIKGKWSSNWKLYKSLNFIDNTSITATNHNNDELKLKYTLDTKSLIIKDNSGLELSYFILELSDKNMILRDIKTMKENIEFEKE